MTIGSSITRPAAIALALLAALPAAQACEFVRTPWGLRLTGCKLSDLTAGRYDLSLDVNPERPRWALPNLVISDVDTTIVGSSANMSATVSNLGVRDAAAFDVQLIVAVTNPLANGAGVSMTTLPAVTVPRLAVGAGATVYPGSVVLPNRSQDWDVCTVAIVDPPTATRSLGAVWESNESDNRWPASAPQQDCCRVYGPKPDLIGPPACL